LRWARSAYLPLTAMNNLCIGFLESAVSTWNLIERARRLNYQVGEESITDLLLLEWKERFTGELLSIAHNKAQEGRSGADWEWWFIGRSGRGIGFRVQAKVLNLASNSFAHLHYYVNRRSPARREYQCENLIHGARRATPPLIPIYCLYTSWLGSDPILGLPKAQPMPQAYGCSLLSVNAVRTLRETHTNTLNALRPHLIPLHDLVCSATHDMDDLADRVLSNWLDSLADTALRALTASLGNETRFSEFFDYSRYEPSERLPRYVRDLSQAQDTIIPAGISHVVVFQQQD
jgi:hypothetical protein